MDKRYQVFVSSTFLDLQEERREVMQALLELGCIPAGMELFPAADEDQWTLIKQIIDDCDYYIVIVGGRYGSISPTGVSYTEMEYRYARDQGKPIIAFLHRDLGAIPSNRSELTPEGRERLEQFRGLCQQKMVKYWSTPEELGSVVSRSLIVLMRTHPGIGWVRASRILSDDASREILRLKGQVEELEAELAAARIEVPKGTEEFAQGDDPLHIGYSYKAYDLLSFESSEYSSGFMTTWNEVFAVIAPHMIHDASEEVLRDATNAWIADVQTGVLYEEMKEFGNAQQLGSFSVYDTDFQTIKVQLRALGLIQQSARSRSLKDTSTYWTLTEYGDSVMTRLRAIRKHSIPGNEAE